ncbi:protein kinase family protein [Bacillus sp. Bva_UNVM-123]|uniref:protein kinase domain-containing protein n=1 Tax=Bacillus sp. Bva_UNVM-123 TaxID=2829798 RepID=UPI00391FAEC1
MMNHTLKNLFKVNPGTVIEGKWHGNRYTIIRELGFGANGIVYLAQLGNKYVALKMSENGMNITSEVNVLKSFAKVQGDCLGPSLLDVDDWLQKGRMTSFYAMEYIQGPDLLTFIEQKGSSWIEVLILQLLSDLQQLHENGWVFGDLKPDNLIVTGPPPRVRCIDVGGTTIQGRAIKEFTEFFDRGYWGLGTRKAEVSYDLFAVAMIVINIAYPKRFSKTSGDYQQLELMVRQKNQLRKYEPVILRALKGKYGSAKEMRDSLLMLTMNEPDKKKPQSSFHANNAGKKGTKLSRRTYVKRKKRWGVLETSFIVVVITFLYMLYIYGQIQ